MSTRTKIGYVLASGDAPALKEFYHLNNRRIVSPNANMRNASGTTVSYLITVFDEAIERIRSLVGQKFCEIFLPLKIEVRRNLK